jgi:uncharacterized membrane protein
MRARVATLVIVALVASCLSLLLLTEDVRATGQAHYTFMAWNLVLAWIPLLLAVALTGVIRLGIGSVVVVPLLAGWILFLPNAPYLVTDLVHLGDGPDAVRADVVMFSAFAVTGVVLGLVSAWFIHDALRRIWRPRTVELIVNASLVLCGVGIYLGRVVQVNSWEVITAPARVAAGVTSHTATAHGWLASAVITLVSAGALVAGYQLVVHIVEPGGQRSMH